MGTAMDAATGVGLSAERLSAARAFVGRHVPPTPAYRWPLLEELTGVETWVKHENHTPVGAFKVRGGLWFVEQLLRDERPAGLISASRGNHAQSLAYAGRAFALPVTIVVPEGNSPDKNAATAAL
ncbi:MAG: pyridoxal-phosphate dependent enzyme, partial [Nocardioides sp.]